MTATLEDVANRKKDKPEPTAEQKLAEELVARDREQGVSLTGPDGLLKQLTKTVMESALNQEMTEHLAMTSTARPVTRAERAQWHPVQNGADQGQRPGGHRGAAGPIGQGKPDGPLGKSRP